MRPGTGPKISQLIAETDGLFLVVSPYITRSAFQHLLGLVGSRPIVVVTEWSVRSVATGATDPRIFYDVQARSDSAQLSLLPGLHGKLYWTDTRALVGSTNLTTRGTGWFGPGNLELLVDTPSDDPDVRAFIDAVREYRFPATSAHVDAALQAARHVDLTASSNDEPPTPLLKSAITDFVEEYRTGELEAPGVCQDATTLAVPPGLSVEDLIRYLQRQLRALAFFDLARTVSEKTGSHADSTRQREVFARSAAAYGIAPPEDDDEADRAWILLMGWMRHLFPKDFQTISTGPQVLVSAVGHFS